MRCGSRLGAVPAGCVARELRAHMWRQHHVAGRAALVRGSAVQPLRSWIGRECGAGGRRVCRRLRPGAYEESAREAAVLRGKLHAEAVLVPRLDHPAAQVHQPAGRGTGQGGGHAPPRVQLQSPVLPRKRNFYPAALGPPLPPAPPPGRRQARSRDSHTVGVARCGRRHHPHAQHPRVVLPERDAVNLQTDEVRCGKGAWIRRSEGCIGCR